MFDISHKHTINKLPVKSIHCEISNDLLSGGMIGTDGSKDSSCICKEVGASVDVDVRHKE